MSCNDVIDLMDNLEISPRDYATPKRSGTFAKFNDDIREPLEKLIKYMRKNLTLENDLKDGIVYAAKGYGSKVGDKRYIKIGWSGKARDTRIKDIRKCEVSVEQYFHTPAFKGAFRAEQILMKLFKASRRRRDFCKCERRHHEWFDKDLGRVRHWTLTLYLWFKTQPYNFEKRELKPAWLHAIDTWETSLNSDRPIYFEEFLMLGPDFAHKSQLVVSPFSSKSITAQKKGSSTFGQPLALQTEPPGTPSPASRTITELKGASSATKLQTKTQRNHQTRFPESQSCQTANKQMTTNKTQTSRTQKYITQRSEQNEGVKGDQLGVRESGYGSDGFEHDDKADQESDDIAEHLHNQHPISTSDVDDEESDDGVDGSSGSAPCDNTDEQDEEDYEEESSNERSDLENGQQGGDCRSDDEPKAKIFELGENNNDEQHSDEVDREQSAKKAVDHHSSIDSSQQEYKNKTINNENDILEYSKPQRRLMDEIGVGDASSEGMKANHASDEHIDEVTSTSQPVIESDNVANGNEATCKKGNFFPDKSINAGSICLESLLGAGKIIQEQRSETKVVGNEEHGKPESGEIHQGNQLLECAIKADDDGNVQVELDDDLNADFTNLSLATTRFDSKAVSFEDIKQFTVERGHIFSHRGDTAQSFCPAPSNNLAEALSIADPLSDSLEANSNATKPTYDRPAAGKGSQTETLSIEAESESPDTTERQQQDINVSSCESTKDAKPLSSIAKIGSDASFDEVNAVKYDFEFQSYGYVPQVFSPKLSIFGPVMTPHSRSLSGYRSLQSSTNSVDASVFGSNIDQRCSENLPALRTSERHEKIADRHGEEAPWYLYSAKKPLPENDKLPTEPSSGFDASIDRPARGLQSAVPGHIFSFEYPHALKSLPITSNSQKLILPSVSDAPATLPTSNDSLTSHFAKLWPVNKAVDTLKGEASTNSRHHAFGPGPQKSSLQPNPSLCEGRRKVLWKGKVIVIHFPPPQRPSENDVVDA